MKFFSGIWGRIVGSPASTLGGALVSVLQLGVHEVVQGVNWGDVRQAVGAVVASAVPLIVGALWKGTPAQVQQNPTAQAAVEKITTAIETAMHNAAMNTADKLIGEIQKVGEVKDEKAITASAPVAS
jgi:hypothetical protein